ncbi:acyl-CoA oxidase [Nitzschia inconspicua]|uniref:Acyl-coenzyme A oxidase n=1 Tax=Nitzschia inconspicua TaxID=303405 RepID=A0A9K3KCF2_9STRA|nr:acyl-CoA oxidase [Nitzschia inconspicua]
MSNDTNTTNAATVSTINPDLLKERQQATFDVERITHMLDGSVSNTDRRRYLEAIIQRDPTGIFDNGNNHYLHRTDRHVRSMAKGVRLIELCRKLGIGNDDDCSGEIIQSPDFQILLEAVADDIPLALHWVMFQPNIVSLCDEQQQAEWLPLCRDWRMIGCYAQTELGHGSNIRSLETTATFLKQADGGMPGGSWIIHSPTLTSTKFWPGTLGRTANHAMVIARLIDGNGIDRGIHNFLVPLRSMEDHTLLKGVTTGDIGPKIGYNNMDNGFAQFDQVVIPRRNMAMRFASVDEDGNYTHNNNNDATSKVAYITMMQVRAMIVNGASKALAMACTITLRYSAVRKQGFAEDGKTEVQILDYTQQQHRILPLLAASYAFFFTGRKLWKQLKDIERKLIAASGGASDNFNQQSSVSKEQVSDIHATSSALKSFTTMVAADGIEECRKACGGHGYLSCSGLPELFTSYLQSPTVEGDNHMLPQQVIRVLLKLVQAVQQQKQNTNLDTYKSCNSYALVPSLQAIIQGRSEQCAAINAQDLCQLSTLLLALRHRAARLLLAVSYQLERDMTETGCSLPTAWNHALVAMAKASKAYSQFLLLQDFMEGILHERQNQVIGRPEVDVLSDLAKLLALCWIEKDMGDFLVDGYMRPEHASWIELNVLQYLSIVRQNAVALVDARDFSDFRLKSVLGRYDGNVYPYIMEAAQKDPLNDVEPGPAYEVALKRLVRDGVGVYSGTASRL